MLQDSFLLLRVLSILIPVYKYNCRELIKSLMDCVEVCDLKAEILLMDDGSDSPPDPEILSFPQNVEYKYIPLAENIGRAAIRNRLAKQARYDFLLFLDCDSGIPDSRFLLNYLPFMNGELGVVSGGRVYQSAPPSESKLYLHWKYGTLRESKSASWRNQKPFERFHSNNFLVSRNLILKCPFDKSLKSYGFEDSLWAMDLMEAKVKLIHIDNPVFHLGLEPKEVFLNKVRSAIQNLARLNSQDKQLGAGPERIYRNYLIHSPFLTTWVKAALKLFKPLFVIQLSGRSPSIRLLDLLKLTYYLEYTGLESKGKAEINR